MNPRNKIVLLWLLVCLFVAAFVYMLVVDMLSINFMLGALFGIAVMHMGERLERYRLKLVGEL